MRPAQWERFAECLTRDINPDLFYPEAGQPIHPDALAACGACWVRLQCLRRGMQLEEHAGTGERFGIWGGLTSRQRTNLASGKPVRFRPASERNRQRGRRPGRIRRAAALTLVTPVTG